MSYPTIDCSYFVLSFRCSEEWHGEQRVLTHHSLHHQPNLLLRHEQFVYPSLVVIGSIAHPYAFTVSSRSDQVAMNAVMVV
jgi:hypothetical protein